MLLSSKNLKISSLAQKRYSGRYVLKDNLGDGYLYKTNQIFSSVRKRTLAIGYRFSSSIPFHPYFVWPLFSLNKIIKEKIIPYRKNGDTLLKLEKARPRAFDVGDIELLPPEKNVLFHESCHAIADWAWTHFDSLKTTKLQSERHIVLKHLFGEACANATEIFGSLFNMDAESAFFYNMNVHFIPTENDRRLIGKSFAVFGHKATFQLLIHCFLHGHFLIQKFSRRHLCQLLKVATSAMPFSKSDTKILKDLAATTLKLSPRSRRQTARIYFLYIGVQGSFKNLVRATPNQLLKTSYQIAPIVDFYTEAILNGI